MELNTDKLIDALDALTESGIISRLTSAGFLSPSVVVWRNVYHYYTSELEKEGGKMQAMQNTADEFGISVRTVQYIRDRMENF